MIISWVVRQRKIKHEFTVVSLAVLSVIYFITKCEQKQKTTFSSIFRKNSLLYMNLQCCTLDK